MLNKLVTGSVEPTPTSNLHSNSTTVVAGVMSVAILSAGSYGLNYLWKWFNEPAPLTAPDLKRYRALTSAYKKIESTFPEQWKLSDTDQPTFLLYKPLVMQSLKENMHTLTLQNSAKSLALTSILALIHRFLECLEARDWMTDHVYDAYDRPNGVEAMFLVEMIKWLLEKAQSLEDSSQDTIDVFAKRIAYCKEVRLHLIKNKTLNKTRNNFKDFIQDLTAELEQYHQHLTHKFESMNFNDLVNKLSDNILGLSAQSLTTMFLLINGADQGTLVVQRFRNPSNSDISMLALQKKQLGQWLLATLDAAGVIDSTFESNKILTMDQVNQHLDGLHPTETTRPHMRAPYPKSILSEEWGHWPFVTATLKPEDTDLSTQRQRHRLFSRESSTATTATKASDYLTHIRALQRITLELYFVRQNLIRTATVASVFGEVWVYGDNVGKAVLDELLCAASDIVQKYKLEFDTFWDKYFVQHYTPYSIIRHQDDISHPAHKWLSTIDQENKISMDKTFIALMDIIDKIRTHALKLPQHLKDIKRTKKALFLDVLGYLECKQKTDSPNYKIISEGLKSLHIDQELNLAGLSQHLPLDKRTEMSSEIKQIIEREVARRVALFKDQALPENTPDDASTSTTQPHSNREPSISTKVDDLLAKYAPSEETPIDLLQAETEDMTRTADSLAEKIEQINIVLAKKTEGEAEAFTSAHNGV